MYLSSMKLQVQNPGKRYPLAGWHPEPMNMNSLILEDSKRSTNEGNINGKMEKKGHAYGHG